MQKFYISLIRLFSCSAIILSFLFFIFMDFSRNFFLADTIKFASIIFCAVLSTIGKNHWKTAGQWITVVCDYFLLFTTKFSFAVFLFILVHCCYILSQINKKRQTSLILLLAASIFSFLEFPILIKLCIIYVLIFSTNLITAFCTLLKTPNIPSCMMFVGLILFAICDINVVIYNLFDSTISHFLIWLFYCPSQFIIALSHQDCDTHNDTT